MRKKSILTISIAILILGFIIFFLTSDMRKYAKAEKSYEQQKYDTATKLYQDLGDYKDSSKKYQLSEHMDKVSNDTGMPSITGMPKEELIVEQGDDLFDIDIWVKENLKISDNITESSILETYLYDGGLNINQPGKYKIKYNVSDEAGNTSKISFDVCVKEPFVVYDAYMEAKELDHSNIEETEYEVTYNGMTIARDELKWLEDGALYRSLAKKLEGFYMSTLGKEFYSPTGEDSITLICGIEKQPTWEEMKPYVDKASLFVTRENSLEAVMRGLQGLSCVSGNFDFSNRIYDFEISDLQAASKELGISEKMLGYTLAMLDEYAPTVEFGNNSYKCTWYRY